MTDKRTYRQCVRIIIINNNNEVVLGKRFNDDGSLMFYEFPGGGIEKGDTLEETVIKECLEEVGLRVRNVKKLNLQYKYDIDFSNPDKAKLYRGGEDTWVVCEYIKSDKKLYNTENDALPYTWETVDNAINLIKNGPESRFNLARLEALAKINILKSKIEIVKIDKSYLNDFVNFRHISSKESGYVNDINKKDALSIIENWNSDFRQGFFLLLDKIIIGQLFVEYDKDKLYLALISVVNKYQGQGYSKLLLEKAKSLAIEHSCYTIELIVHRDNKKAIAFYEKNNFKFKEYYRKDKSNMIYYLENFVAEETFKFSQEKNINRLFDW